MMGQGAEGEGEQGHRGEGGVVRAAEEPPSPRGPAGTPHTGGSTRPLSPGNGAQPRSCGEALSLSARSQLRAAPPEGSPAPGTPSSPSQTLLPVTHMNPEFLYTSVYSELTLRDKQLFPLSPHTFNSIILNINKDLVLGAWQLHRQQSASWCKVGDQPCPFSSWDHLAPVSRVQIEQSRR